MKIDYHHRDCVEIDTSNRSKTQKGIKMIKAKELDQAKWNPRAWFHKTRSEKCSWDGEDFYVNRSSFKKFIKHQADNAAKTVSTKRSDIAVSMKQYLTDMSQKKFNEKMKEATQQLENIFGLKDFGDIRQKFLSPPALDMWEYFQKTPSKQDENGNTFAHLFFIKLQEALKNDQYERSESHENPLFSKKILDTEIQDSLRNLVWTHKLNGCITDLSNKDRKTIADLIEELQNPCFKTWFDEYKKVNTPSR